MDIPALYVVLFFMGSVSTDPNVSLVQQSTAPHAARQPLRETVALTAGSAL
jgi:hypothetical protein